MGGRVTHLAAERACVPGMLRDFHLFHLLSERGTVTLHVQIHQNNKTVTSTLCLQGESELEDTHSAILSSNANLPGSFCLLKCPASQSTQIRVQVKRQTILRCRWSRLQFLEPSLGLGDCHYWVDTLGSFRSTV